MLVAVDEFVCEDAGEFAGGVRVGFCPGDVGEGEVDFLVVGVEFYAGGVGDALEVADDEGYRAGWGDAGLEMGRVVMVVRWRRGVEMGYDCGEGVYGDGVKVWEGGEEGFGGRMGEVVCPEAEFWGGQGILWRRGG